MSQELDKNANNSKTLDNQQTVPHSNSLNDPNKKLNSEKKVQQKLSPIQQLFVDSQQSQNQKQSDKKNLKQSRKLLVNDEQTLTRQSNALNKESQQHNQEAQQNNTTNTITQNNVEDTTTLPKISYCFAPRQRFTQSQDASQFINEIVNNNLHSVDQVVNNNLHPVGQEQSETQQMYNIIVTFYQNKNQKNQNSDSNGCEQPQMVSIKKDNDIYGIQGSLTNIDEHPNQNYQHESQPIINRQPDDYSHEIDLSDNHHHHYQQNRQPQQIHEIDISKNKQESQKPSNIFQKMKKNMENFNESNTISKKLDLPKEQMVAIYHHSKQYEQAYQNIKTLYEDWLLVSRTKQSQFFQKKVFERLSQQYEKYLQVVYFYPKPLNRIGALLLQDGQFVINYINSVTHYLSGRIFLVHFLFGVLQPNLTIHLPEYYQLKQRMLQDNKIEADRLIQQQKQKQNWKNAQTLSANSQAQTNLSTKVQFNSVISQRDNFTKSEQKLILNKSYKQKLQQIEQLQQYENQERTDQNNKKNKFDSNFNINNLENSIQNNNSLSNKAKKQQKSAQKQVPSFKPIKLSQAKEVQLKIQGTMSLINQNKKIDYSSKKKQENVIQEFDLVEKKQVRVTKRKPNINQAANQNVFKSQMKKLKDLPQSKSKKVHIASPSKQQEQIESNSKVNLGSKYHYSLIETKSNQKHLVQLRKSARVASKSKGKNQNTSVKKSNGRSKGKSKSKGKNSKKTSKANSQVSNNQQTQDEDFVEEIQVNWIKQHFNQIKINNAYLYEEFSAMTKKDKQITKFLKELEKHNSFDLMDQAYDQLQHFDQQNDPQQLNGGLQAPPLTQTGQQQTKIQSQKPKSQRSQNLSQNSQMTFEMKKKIFNQNKQKFKINKDLPLTVQCVITPNVGNLGIYALLKLGRVSQFDLGTKYAVTPITQLKYANKKHILESIEITKMLVQQEYRDNIAYVGLNSFLRDIIQKEAARISSTKQNKKNTQTRSQQK